MGFSMDRRVCWVIARLTPMMKFHYLPHLNGFLLLPALYAAVAIHEAGHLLVGRIVGMLPGALVIGGIVIFKSGRRWLIRLHYRRIFGGGLSKFLPSKARFSARGFRVDGCGWTDRQPCVHGRFWLWSD